MCLLLAHDWLPFRSVDDIQLASSLDSGISLSEDIYLDLNGMSRHLDIQNRKKSDDEVCKFFI